MKIINRSTKKSVVGRYAGEEEPQRAKRGTENLIVVVGRAPPCVRAGVCTPC